MDSLSDRLQIRERQVEKQGKEIEFKLKHSDSQVNTELLELTPAANDMIIPASISDQPNINMDGRSLEVIMNVQLNKVELMGSQKSAVLNTDEIVKLPGTISQHKQTLQLCQTLSFEDKITGKCFEF